MANGKARAVAALLASVLQWGSMSMNAEAMTTRARFALKAPAYYFSDPRALAVLDAAMKGDATAARAAVAQGAPLDAEGPVSNPDNRLRLLHYAIAARKPDAVRLLVELGADPELTTRGFGPALLFAVTLNDPQALGAMLDARPFVSLALETQQELLFRAETLGRMPCSELLLDRGAPVDLRDSTGYTILMRAISVRDVERAKRLLARGASVNVQSKGGVTPGNQVQGLLQVTQAGTPAHTAVLELKAELEARGIVFPVPTVQEIRAARRPP